MMIDMILIIIVSKTHILKYIIVGDVHYLIRLTCHLSIGQTMRDSNHTARHTKIDRVIQ